MKTKHNPERKKFRGISYSVGWGTVRVSVLREKDRVRTERKGRRNG